MGDLVKSEKITDFLPAKLWFAYLLGVLASGLVLAAVYVYGGGPSLAQKQSFAAVDSMLFTVTAVSTGFTLTGMMYYFTRDISTALAPLTGVAFSLYSGFEDVLVYLICIPSDVGRCAETNSFPGKWTWLTDSTVGETVTSLGFSFVTDYTIFASILAWLLGTILLLKIFHSFEASVGGWEI